METIDITEQALQKARLQGQMEAYRAAMKECSKKVPCANSSVGGRTAIEIHNGIWDLLRVAEAASLAM